MTNNEQRIAIAEACGWTPVAIDSWIDYTEALHEYQLDEIPVDEFYRRHLRKDPKPPAPPDYLNDLNAMHKAEATLSEHDQARYQDVLAFMFVGPSETYPLFQVIHSTAAQRAEAFLRTLGRWKDK